MTEQSSADQAHQIALDMQEQLGIRPATKPTRDQLAHPDASHDAAASHVQAILSDMRVAAGIRPPHPGPNR